ncbi:hypothetical protein jhhlp_004584 [Lomentospora prolificans]|uniref:Uncharacterized protein n=1 Tax=Lomentospora prolificans TaxID=41688 RepID=A0A2N3NC20_9PEZI|nr:hypothetical protein jhhlp_004584 [Lomentospora prolificans]
MGEPLSTNEVVRRLQEAKPPATDSFTYLALLDQHMTSELLPELLDILQDAELTKLIGWDLVDMLIDVPGSEECLETVARLGNPREVILKVLEVLEKTSVEGEDELHGRPDAERGAEIPEANESRADAPTSSSKFITLLGMLGILHKRLKVRYPSRFLHTTLQTVHRCYIPTRERTAALISFVRSVSGSARPPLPSRKSSTTLSNPFEATDPSKNAPDPEAEAEDPIEADLMVRLLQSFMTCVFESFVNSNEIGWASRLVEFYNPSKIVPGRKTVMQSFRDDPDLLARDALLGQLAALAGDLGLASYKSNKIAELCAAPIQPDPMAVEPDSEKPDLIKLSTTGFWCLTAYWVFASEVFDSDFVKPEMYIFPDLYDIVHRYLGEEDAQAKIIENPGVVESLIVIGSWLYENNHIASPKVENPAFMTFHHYLTLCAVFHQSLHIRNAATTLAGQILHADPDDEDRLKILDDLLENCVFSSLQACAVTWLREEIIAAGSSKSDNVFSSPECIESLQYNLFPNVANLSGADTDELVDFWGENHPFHLQVANFAYFLLAGKDFKHLVPEGMAAAVGERYVKPMLNAAKTLSEKAGSEKIAPPTHHIDVQVFIDRLESLPLEG